MFMRIPKIRYSLKLLFIVTTIFTLWLGLVAVNANRQKALVDSLEREGIKVFYDCDVDEYGIIIGTPPPLKSVWLRSILGRHYFDAAVRVNLGYSEFTGDYEKAADLISKAPHLKQIVLGSYPPYGTEHRLTHAAFAKILSSADWKNLNFAFNDCTAKSLELLANKQSIIHLHICDYTINGTKLKLDAETVTNQISKMKQLRGFAISFRISPTQLERLQRALPDALIGEVSEVLVGF